MPVSVWNDVRNKARIFVYVEWPPRGYTGLVFTHSPFVLPSVENKYSYLLQRRHIAIVLFLFSFSFTPIFGLT